MNVVEKSHLNDTFTTPTIRMGNKRQAQVARARQRIEEASYLELRGLLETMADALEKHGALRLMVDVAEERGLERKSDAELQHEAGRRAVAFPGGVA